MFDTLTYANKLKEAGFTERQAQAQAEALVAVVDDNLATKRDLKEMEAAQKRDLKELEMRQEARIREMELKFEGRFLQMDGRLHLINWMLGLALAGIAGILSLMMKALFTA